LPNASSWGGDFVDQFSLALDALGNPLGSNGTSRSLTEARDHPSRGGQRLKRDVPPDVAHRQLLRQLG